MAKIDQYEKALEYMNYGDINVRTTKWKLPVFKELPAHFEELTYIYHPVTFGGNLPDNMC